MCAAHGAVLGGGLAICLLTDYVACNDAATLQVGERSRRIHPAGLLTRTLADAVGQDVAMDLYLSERLLSPREACEIGLVEEVVTSVSNAQQFAYDRTGHECDNRIWTAPKPRCYPGGRGTRVRTKPSKG